jgi:LysR family transcriptional regulator, glycine cleavage system transcriptional activator
VTLSEGKQILPPKIRRPPLADLHAFEAAARHLSFTRAASELGVTQGAVSQRVRKLEELLGLQLFERLTRALALTADGKVLAEAVGHGIDRIDEGLAAIDRQQRPGAETTLVLSAAPGFVCRWLLPRLVRLRSEAEAWRAAACCSGSGG